MLNSIESVIEHLESKQQRLAETIAFLRKEFAADPGPLTPPPPPEPKIKRGRPKRAKAESNGSSRRIKLIDAIREIVSGWSAAFGCDLLRKTIESRYPGINTESTSVYLIDMAQRGELTREGTGREAIYCKLKLNEKFSVSPKEAAYQEFRKTIPAPATED